jgi:hypothetical protein
MILLKETAGDTLIGAIDGVNKLYEVNYDYIADKVVVYINGQRKIDFLDDGSTLIPPRQVQLKEPLLVGDNLEIEYAVDTPAGGGALGGLPIISGATEDLPTITPDQRLPSQRAQILEPHASLRKLIPALLARGLRPAILDSRARDEEEEELEDITALQSRVICQPGDAVGRWVYLMGPMVGNRYVVEQADPDDPTKIPAWGILISKSSSTRGVVHWFGILEDIVTNLSLADGDRVLWLGSGGVTAQAPPGGGAYQQALGTVLDANTILVEPDWEELPIPVYASHFDTSDGNTNAVVPDIGTTSRNVADGAAHFDIGGWTPGTAHPTTRTSPQAWATPEAFSIINNTSTILEATVFDADGVTPLATHQVTLTGNSSTSNAGITLTVSGWAADLNKWKAVAEMSLDLTTILPTGGRFSVCLRHTNGGDGVFTYTQNDLFYDKETNAAALSGVSVAETGGSVVTRFLSGVEYYDLGSEFTIGISDIDDLNDESYPDTQVNAEGDEYGLAALALAGAQLTGWTNIWNDADSNFQKTDWAITQANLTVKSLLANIRARTQDWAAGSWINSPDAGILIETHISANTRLVEDFYDEAWRCALGADFDAAAARGWTSSADLGAGDGLYFDGGCERNVEDWSLYNPNAGGQPDYAGQDATVYLIREFQHDGSASSGFTLNISGTYTSLEYKLAAAWDGTPSGGTVWIDGLSDFNAANWNNGNPTGGTGGKTGAGHYTFGTNNIINTGDTLYVRIGFAAGERITGLSVVFD